MSLVPKSVTNNLFYCPENYHGGWRKKEKYGFKEYLSSMKIL
jgi:hypothetical protein